MRRTLALLVVVLAAPAASAEPIVATDALPAVARRTVAAEIARARRADPASFAAVAAVLARVPELEAERRGDLAIVTPELRGLGPWALADALLTRDGAPLAAAVGLVEAAGATREPRLAPLWRAILDGDEPRDEVLRAAAGALARLDTDEIAAELAARARGPGGDAVLASMGHCRRVPVALALAQALDRGPPPATARRIIRSLAELGAAWAWETAPLRLRPEATRVRALAREALGRAAASPDEATRRAAAIARQVVGE